MKVFEGYEFLETSGRISSYRLKSNGLRVLLAPAGNAPVATFMITYQVGSRNESIGETGATHFLEHMMFKGTERFSKKSGKTIFNVLQARGAQVNATTWNDRTNYYEMLPSEHLSLAIDIEADRMRNLSLDPEEIENERSVILNEFDRGENEPIRRLMHAVWATSYVAHPYHHPTIGWRKDIEQVTAQGLRSFYDRFYWPNNATVSVIGGYEDDAVMSEIRNKFEPIPSGPSSEVSFDGLEPGQTGEKSVVVSMAGGMPALMLAYKIPNVHHADWPALFLLGAILSSGKSSRLAVELVDTGLVTWQTASPSSFQDPGLFSILLQLNPSVELNEVEDRVQKTLDSLKEDGITADEMRRALKKAAAQLLYSRDGSFSIASQLNEAIASGDWKLYTQFLERLNAVTIDDVRRVASAYCQQKSSTKGVFRPA